MPRGDDSTERRGAVTLRHIAERVGVSVATVSRVLNYDPTLSVGDATRQSVIEAAEAMNYTPRRRKPRPVPAGSVTRIALLHFRTPDSEFRDPYFVAMRLGIESRCAALQFEVTKLYRSQDSAITQIPREVRGILVIGRHDEAEMAALRARWVPIVCVDWHPLGDGIDRVGSDLRLATEKLLTALDGLGYRRIAMAGWAEDHAPTEREPRARAYAAWMAERGRFDEDLLILGSNSEESGHDVAGRLLDRPERPDALVVTNDTMAMGAYRAIHERGLKIPQDIAVASFNDISAARFLSPPLTTVRLPAETIGRQAVDLLVERFAGRELARQVNIETKIVWRGSTRSPEADKPAAERLPASG